MFLPKVYKHSKWLCLAIILFFAGQLFINYKHGMVFSPFFHYGMYSHKILIEKNYPIIEVFANGKLLEGHDFSPQQWDKIMLPIQYLKNIKRSNSLYENEVKRLMQKVHLTTTEQNFIQQCDVPSFEKWYRNYLADIIGQSVSQLEIIERIYHYNGFELNKTDSIKNLSLLCN